MSTLDVYGFSLADPVTTGKGAKFVPVKAHPAWTPGPLKILFEPGNFAGALGDRVNMVFAASPEIASQLRALDSYVKVHLERTSERVIGKKLSEADVNYRYKPLLKPSDKYEPSFKCKVNLVKVRIWNNEKAPAEAPESWRGLMVHPRLLVKGLWITEKEFGLQLEATDLMLPDPEEETVIECPF